MGSEQCAAGVDEDTLLDDEQQFAEHQRALAISRFRMLGATFAIGLTIAFLGDALSLHDKPVFRLICIVAPLQVGVTLLVRWALGNLAFAKRHALWFGAFTYATTAGLGAVTLSDMGGLDGPYFYASYILPTLSTPIPCRRPARVGLIIAGAGTFLAVFFLRHPEYTAHPSLHIAVSYLLLGFATSFFLGDLLNKQVKESFTLTRELARERALLKDRNSALEGEVGQQRTRLDGLIARLEETRKDERDDLAQALHDDLGQLVVGARMELNLMEHVLADGGSFSDDRLARLYGLVDEIENSMRTVVTDLRVVTGPLEQAVQRIVERLGAAPFAINVVVDVAVDPGHEASEACLRVVQEGLTNASKHAKPTTVDVSLRLDGETLYVAVADDGTAASVAPGPQNGLGLAGLRTRVNALGGQLSFNKGPRGATLCAELPAFG